MPNDSPFKPVTERFQDCRGRLPAVTMRRNVDARRMFFELQKPTVVFPQEEGEQSGVLRTSVDHGSNCRLFALRLRTRRSARYTRRVHESRTFLPPHEDGSADIPVCGFTGHSCPVSVKP